MRDAYQEDLDQTFASLAAICAQVRSAVDLATEALTQADADKAERVIAGDAAIDSARERLDDTVFNLISLQQPVAGDLRTMVAALRMSTELERMGDLAVHIAKVARLRVPEVAVPSAVEPIFTAMSQLASTMVGQAHQVIIDRDVDAALALGAMDEEMDDLRRRSFTSLLSKEWPHGVEPAVDVALLGRYYERIADHAVSLANRVVFVVTGDVPAKLVG